MKFADALLRSFFIVLQPRLSAVEAEAGGLRLSGRSATKRMFLLRPRAATVVTIVAGSQGVRQKPVVASEKC